MTSDFESNILSYIINPLYHAEQYIAILDDNIFDIVEHQTTFTLIQGFYKEYRKLPNKITLLEYAERQFRKNNYEPEDYKPTLKYIKRHLYESVEANILFVKETIIEHVQFKRSKNLFIDFSDKLHEGVSVFREIKKQMVEIVNLSETGYENIIKRGGNILITGVPDLIKNINVIQTPFRGLNNTMGAKGMVSPELVILMSASKAFKTGLLIYITVQLTRAGYKCYYVDGENGYNSIATRIVQCYVTATKDEVLNNEFEDIPEMTIIEMFDAMSEQISILGGSLYIDSFATSTATISDVSDSLDKYKEETGVVPDFVVFDSPEHFNPTIEKREDTLNSQQVIKDILAFNVKQNCVSLAPAQVNRDAIGKNMYTIKDIGRDYGIIRYAHTILSIIRSEEEKAAGIAQIYSIAQREGKDHVGASMLKIQEEKMQVEEISYDEAGEIMGNSNYSQKEIAKKTHKVRTETREIKRQITK